MDSQVDLTSQKNKLKDFASSNSDAKKIDKNLCTDESRIYQMNIYLHLNI